MADDRIVLITGATGKQGGAVCRELAGKGFRIRAMTRNPDGDAARELQKLDGVEVMRGDLDDESSLKKVLNGAWGVFSVQNTWEAGVEQEEEQGKRLAHLARESGVQHLVYSSVGSAHRDTGIPHFDNKWRVEETVRGLEFPSYAILRPVFFMENLPTPWFMYEDKIVSALPPDTVVQMVAVKDIGRVGARLFTHADEMKGREIDLAGDEATMPQATEALSEGMGKKLELVQIPMEKVREQSEEFAVMLEWFVRVGYNAAIPALEKEFGKLTKLPEWVREEVRG
jgi:uncharacterized protein YbjT (DUF2867 family)